MKKKNFKKKKKKKKKSKSLDKEKYKKTRHKILLQNEKQLKKNHATNLKHFKFPFCSYNHILMWYMTHHMLSFLHFRYVCEHKNPMMSLMEEKRLTNFRLHKYFSWPVSTMPPNTKDCYIVKICHINFHYVILLLMVCLSYFVRFWNFDYV